MRLLTIFIFLAWASAVPAAGSSLDWSQEVTEGWLKEQNLVLTTYGNGDLLNALAQGEFVAYGEAVGNPALQNAAQRCITAEHAAEIVAYRNAVEALQGFRVVGDTLIKDLAENDDAVKMCLSRMLAQIEVAKVKCSAPEEMAVALVKAPLFGSEGIITELMEWIYSSPQLRKLIEGEGPRFLPRQQLPRGSHDGLIVDVTDAGIAPAVFNRIYAVTGELLYTPLMIPFEQVIHSGGPAYAGSLDQARALLALRGAKHPLVIKARKGTTAADLAVSAQDALSAYAADLGSGFFAAGKVALVFKQ